MKAVLFLLYFLGGPIIVGALAAVLYLLTLFAFTRLQGQPKADIAGKAILTAGGVASALITFLVIGPNGSVSMGLVFSVLFVVALSAIVWIPLGDLIWWGASRLRQRLCPCRT